MHVMLATSVNTMSVLDAALECAAGTIVPRKNNRISGVGSGWLASASLGACGGTALKPLILSGCCPALMTRCLMPTSALPMTCDVSTWHASRMVACCSCVRWPAMQALDIADAKGMNPATNSSVDPPEPEPAASSDLICCSVRPSSAVMASLELAMIAC